VSKYQVKASSGATGRYWVILDVDGGRVVWDTDEYCEALAMSEALNEWEM
jgi:hypothetical protein